MTIACVGITVLDRVFSVENLPSIGGKYVANDYFEVGGGPAATAAVAIKKLGGEVEFIGRVGDDSVAAAMKKEFCDYGVGLQYIRTIENSLSSFSAIMVDNKGERQIVNYQDNTLSRDPEWLAEIDFSQFSALLCDVRWHEGSFLALKKAREAGIPTILDADITPEDITELVKLSNHIVFSEPGLQKYTQEKSAVDALKIAQKTTPGKVYVTLGADGCLWLENNEIKHLPGDKVDVVDTTGAGDVFHGAFTLAIAENMNATDAVRFSGATAALKCTKPGGRSGIPDRNQVEHFINTSH